MCDDVTERVTKLLADLESDSFTNFGLSVLGIAVSHINESNCKLMSPEHYR